MKKILLLLLLLTLVAGNASSQIKKEVRSTKTTAKKKVKTKTVVYNNKDAVAFGLKGKVREVKTEYARVGTQNFWTESQLNFNIYGELFYLDNKLVENKIYDKQNRLIEVVKSTDRYKFEYDEKGRIKKYTTCYEASFVKGKPIQYNIYEYIYDNNIITSCNYNTYSSDGSGTPQNLVYKYRNYKFDNNGNWIYREKDDIQYVRTIIYY